MHGEASALIAAASRPRRGVAAIVALVVVCATACLVALAASPAQRAVVLTSKYTVTGDVDVPEHPPGMPYVKVPPMGDVAVTDPDGNAIGHVNFKTLPPPPAPPPTIIRFGDVGVAPAGCPMCPVLDKEGVKKQKEELKKQEYRMKRLKGMEQANEVKIEEDVDSMKSLKQVMQESLFKVKELIKKQDVELENDMLAKEAQVGPRGRRGPEGYDGANGLNGEPGENGVRGRAGKTGVSGPMGPPGPQGPRGPKGQEGIGGGKGKVGKLGMVGPKGPQGHIGPGSVTVGCERIGGQMFDGVCFKSSMPGRDKDNVPDGCKAMVPSAEWKEKHFVHLAKMFATRTLSGTIDHGSHGGNCDNHKAVMSFTQGEAASRAWVNSESFKFDPTGSGSTCTLYNGDTTVAVYACTV
uniref:Uncharacterized protein n=1 Tax=Hemiselmis tepida TaxID=464990 RepID=A0A7S0VU92_9CRYP|mmetsp:Transcript_21281/g.53605  ORF Transcript_21281/g.53605 Transcript_21281/m.53605 type:complete len:409 (+) Transcript_21281:26-1252(+)